MADTNEMQNIILELVMAENLEEENLQAIEMENDCAKICTVL